MANFLDRLRRPRSAPPASPPPPDASADLSAEPALPPASGRLMYDPSQRQVLEPQLAALNETLPDDPDSLAFRELIDRLRAHRPALAAAVQGMVRDTSIEADNAILTHAAERARRAAAPGERLRALFTTTNARGEPVFNKAAAGIAGLTAGLVLFGAVALYSPNTGGTPTTAAATTPPTAGGTTVTNPDGSTTTTYPDGSTLTVRQDGTKIARQQSGETLTVQPDGTRVTEYPDGRVLTKHVDGTSTEKLADGSVVTRDASGGVTGTTPPGSASADGGAPLAGLTTTPGTTSSEATSQDPSIATAAPGTPPVAPAPTPSAPLTPPPSVDPYQGTPYEAGIYNPTDAERAAAAPVTLPSAASPSLAARQLDEPDEIGAAGPPALAPTPATPATPSASGSPIVLTPAPSTTGDGAVSAPTWGDPAPVGGGRVNAVPASPRPAAVPPALTVRRVAPTGETARASGTAPGGGGVVVYRAPTPPPFTAQRREASPSEGAQSVRRVAAEAGSAGLVVRRVAGGEASGAPGVAPTTAPAADTSAALTATPSAAETRSSGGTGSAPSGGGVLVVYRGSAAPVALSRVSRPTEERETPALTGTPVVTGTPAVTAPSAAGNGPITPAQVPSPLTPAAASMAEAAPPTIAPLAPDVRSATPAPSTPPAPPTPPRAATADTAGERAAVSPYRLGQRVLAKLETGVLVAEGGTTLPVYASTADGTLWRGTVSLDATKRVLVLFDAAVLRDGTNVAVQAAAYHLDGTPGLKARYRDLAPTLVNDLVRGAVSGVKDFVDATLQATTSTISPSGVASVSRAAPSLAQSIAGSAAGVFQLPTTKNTFVTVAELPVGTTFALVYGPTGGER